MKNNSRIEALPGFCRTHNRKATFLLVVLSAGLTLPVVRAQDSERSGEQVVDSVCAACHASGANGAPKIGDTDAWSDRASQGLSSLTRHALEGIRNMPAHGGDPQLSDLEIARAVTYMVNQSGGNWIEPASSADLATERSGEQVVKAQCSNCHAEGVGGAPKIGDMQAWVQRLQNGLPYLVSSAIRGHGGMPPRGGQANLTDAELRSAILYMYNPTGTPAGSAPVAATPSARKAADPNHQTVDGIDMYLGFMSTEDLRALPPDAPERSMHGGIPKGSGYYHVNVSLYDANSGKPISDAQVQMGFGLAGRSNAPIELEPMQFGGSYGNYVQLKPGTLYLITLSVKRPGASGTVKATFEHKSE